MCVGWDRPWIYLTSVVLSAAGHANDVGLFLDQTEARKAEKKFWTPLSLSQGLDDRPTLSEGLDPPLWVICSKKNNSQHYIK